MSMPSTMRLLFCTFLLAVAISPPHAQVAFDHKKLDARIDIKLTDASMADAIATLAKVSGIEVAGPPEPKEGLTADLKNQTVRTVIEALAKMSGLTWYIEGNVVVFRRPLTIPAYEASEKLPDKIDLQEGMTEVLRTLDDAQLLRLSRGIPLNYAELTPPQQQLLRAMLSSAVGVTTSGEVIKQLPAPEQLSISFYVMPYLLIPKTSGSGELTIRLDSTPYIYLKTVGGR